MVFFCLQQLILVKTSKGEYLFHYNPIFLKKITQLYTFEGNFISNHSFNTKKGNWVIVVRVSIHFLSMIKWKSSKELKTHYDEPSKPFLQDYIDKKSYAKSKKKVMMVPGDFTKEIYANGSINRKANLCRWFQNNYEMFHDKI